MGGTFADGFEAGALSGLQSGISSGIGGASSLDGPSIGNLGAGITVKRVLAHGLVGGAFARARGDSFGSGFATGVFTKLSAGKLSESIPGKFGGAAASAIIGGTASTLSGGKFANGALSGAFGYLYNFWSHRFAGNYSPPNVNVDAETIKDIAGYTPIVGNAISAYDTIIAGIDGDWEGVAWGVAGTLGGGWLKGAKSVQKGIRSLEKRIAEHEKKLADFKANPSGIEQASNGQYESVNSRLYFTRKYTSWNNVAYSKL